jgi:hypothetical protein
VKLQIPASLLFLLLLAGCSRPLSSPFTSSPSEVVKSFYMSCNSGEYSKAESSLSADAQRLMHSEIGAMAGGTKGVCDQNTRRGTIAGVDTVSEEIRGEGATVVVSIRYKDGQAQRDDKNSLIKENGAWKLVPGD